jgi:hypothetical protein
MLEFLNELTKLCNNHNIWLHGNMRIIQVDDSYDKSTESIEVLESITYGDGSKNSYGPFLKSSILQHHISSDVVVSSSNLAFMDPTKLNFNKHVPEGFKDVMRNIDKSLPKQHKMNKF